MNVGLVGYLDMRFHRLTLFLLAVISHVLPSLPFFFVPIGNNVAELLGLGRSLRLLVLFRLLF